MSTIRLLYCRHRSVYTPILRLGMWSSWTHEAVVVGDEEDTLIEATLWRGGVRRRSLALVMSEVSKASFRDIECPDPKAAYDFLREQIGKPYDLAGAAGLAVNRDWQKDDAWFCSELAEAALAAGGNCRFINSPRRVTPQLSWMVR